METRTYLINGYIQNQRVGYWIKAASAGEALLQVLRPLADSRDGFISIMYLNIRPLPPQYKEPDPVPF